MNDELRRIRKDMNLSQAAFGALLGVHQTTVCRWERDEATPSLATVIAARTLQQTPQEAS